MEALIRALNVLSAVMMLAAGIYIEFVFWPLLTPETQGVIGAMVWLYYFSQCEPFVVARRNNSGQVRRLQKSKKYRLD